MKFLSLLSLFLVSSACLLAHNPETAHSPLHEFHLKNQRHLHASFLMMRGDSVFLETENGSIKAFLLPTFSEKDQTFFREKMAAIEKMNQHKMATQPVQTADNQVLLKRSDWFLGLALLAFASLAGFFFLKKNKKWSLVALLGGAAIFSGFKTGTVQKMLETDPLFMDSAFEPFKPHIATHWDNTWFYVESNGIPTTHPMMAGITKWQQQVPIPQCYIGANAWQIPLNPVLAAQPVPVNQQHFLRGAVAIAANGIPIFSPYTNTGADAFLDGQLDQWGGHSGRADDYHYHIAPMFLDTQTIDILPIAFALDGFAVYADHEPDGSPMLPLDANHGHFDGAGVYHYHGSPTAPYMIGNMVGQVTEDATLQIIPQAKAMPVRPSLTPLSSAVITDCTPNATQNGYILTYTKDGVTYKVDYSWTPGGVYTYHFISPSGTTTETYSGHLPCEVSVSTDDFFSFEKQLTVFPNPTSGSIFLKISDLTPIELVDVQFFDAKGRLVFQKERVGTMLEIGGLAQGVYFLKIKSGKGEISRKIIVQ